MADRLGFVGIGTMGTPMCKRLLAAGYRLVVYDTRPEASALLVAEGAEAATSPADLARQCPKVITMLPNSAVVENVVLGNEGLREGLAPGSVLIDMGSSIPTSTRKIAEMLASKSVGMIDAPVSGGPVGAAEGTLTIMVGGSDQLYEACLPILQAMGKHIFHVGPVGAGHTIKTVNNLIYAVSMLGVAEALVLGVKAGLSANKIVEVVSTGSGRCYALDTKTPRHILAGNYKPGFATDLLYKDVDIATTLGRELGVPMLAAALVQQLLAVARGRGMGALDNSCIVKLIEESAGARVADAGD